MSLDLHLEYKVCQAGPIKSVPTLNALGSLQLSKSAIMYMINFLVDGQVMSKSKEQMDGEGGPGTNLELQKVKKDYQSTASESDGEICVD